MYCLYIFLTLCFACTLSAASPVDPHRQLDGIFRHMPGEGGGVKGHSITQKKSRVGIYPRDPDRDGHLRKGEYYCGDKICMLQPGQKPKGCVICQYPVLPNIPHSSIDFDEEIDQQ